MDQQNPLAEAIKFIEQHLTLGVPIEHIREHFITHGWPAHHVEDAIAQATKPAVVEPAAPVPREHYTVTRALRDGFAAMRAQAQLYTLALLVGAAVFIIGTKIGTSLEYTLLRHSGSGSFSGYVSLAIVSGFLDGIWKVLVSTFVLACTSQLLWPNKHLKVTAERMFKQAAVETPRAALASMIATFITFGPFIILSIIGLISLLNSSLLEASAVHHQLFSLVFPFMGLIWLFIASLRLSLVQQVALFEPHRSIRDMMRRSYFLLLNGGQWFVFKGAFVLAVLYVGYRNFYHSSVFSSYSPVNIIFLIGLILVNIVAQAALTMLYLNRAAVRGDS